MRKLKIIFVTFFLLFSCGLYAMQTKVNLTIVSGKASVANIVILNKAYTINLDKNGSGSVTVPLNERTFCQLEYGKISADVYLIPEKEITLTLDPKDWRGDSMVVVCDDGGINRTIMEFSKKAFKSATSCEFTLNEEEFLKKVHLQLEAQYREIETTDVPKDVRDMLKASAKFEMVGWIYKYPRFHHYGKKMSKADFESFSKFNQYIFDSYEENPDYLKLKSYRFFIINWVYELMQLRCHGEPYILKKEKACEYILKNTNDKFVREYLLSSTVYSYIKSDGINGADKIIGCFRENVKNPIYTIPFEQEYLKWKNVLPGTEAFDFNYIDVNEKRVKLSDFKGKNVVIDVWATWCKPCCYEIPYLKKLEHKYKHKNIVFVSLSMDKDKQAWLKMVERDTLKGVQLNFENNRDFMNHFNISSIPRFLVIDKNGKVVNATAPKPSSGNFEAILDKLED